MNYETGRPSFALPVGDYVVRIDGVNPREFGDNTGFQLDLTIIGGPQHNKVIKSVVFQDSKLLWQLIHCVDKPIGTGSSGNTTTFNPDDWRGCVVRITNGHRVRNGVTYNSIQAICSDETKPKNKKEKEEKEEAPF